MRRIVLAVGTTLLAVVLLGDVALADHLRTVCDVHATPSARLEQGYVLDVRLRTTDGAPVNEATVRFYEVVELFGTREMLIATAVTDGQGNGSATYLPARTGPHQIVVRFAGRDHFTRAEGRVDVEATVAAPPYRPETMPLSSFTAAVPYGVGMVVLSVWALIAFALFGTARGILRGAHAHPEKGDIA